MLESSSSESFTQPSGEKLQRWGVLGLSLGLLIWGLCIIVSPFISPLSWAAVLALGTWPIHTRVRSRFPKWPAFSASLSSLLIISLAVALILPVLSGLGPELKGATQKASSYLSSHQEALESRIASIPVVGKTLIENLKNLQDRTQELNSLGQQLSKTLVGTATLAAQGAAWLGFNVSFFCFFVFCFFYYGESVKDQLQKAIHRIDSDAEKYFHLAQHTVTGVLYGLVFTALAQGTLAGIGYAIAGVRAPILFGVLTGFLSFVPVGPPLVYLPLSLAFALNGDPVRGLLLALWGTVLVSSADNILKPYFIAREANLPLPFVLVGVSGGILGFGLIGVFVGPVIVGVIRSLWMSWLNPENSSTPEPEVIEAQESGIEIGSEGSQEVLDENSETE